MLKSMALLRRPSSRESLPCSNPPTPPGVIWSERFDLCAKVQEVMNATPLMCMDEGKLKFDVACIERMHANSPAKQLLSRFRESLKSVDVAECTKSQSEATSCSAVGANKRVREEEKVLETEQDDEIARSFRLSRKKQRSETTEEYTGLPITAFETHHETQSTNMEVLCVPVGASGLDRITFYDTNNKCLTKAYVQIPRHAYDNMPMKHVSPGKEFKMLLLDGLGFKTGRHLSAQHAVRLAAHRKLCTNIWCRVLGCGTDPCYKLFCGVSERLKSDYERHWRSSRKHALRAWGHSFHMCADAA